VAGHPRSAPSAPDANAGKVHVPHLNLDPIQSLQPWPVIVTCLHKELEIPALPATDWLTVLMTDPVQLDDIFPGLLGEEWVDWVEDQLLSGALDADDYQDTVLSIIETVSARKWWITLRLVDLAKSSWDVIGPEMMLRGVDASRISLSAWLDVVLITTLKNMEPKDTQMFTSRLEAAPPGEAEPEEMEMSQSAFLALGSE
jgi:hypothetical protein